MSTKGLSSLPLVVLQMHIGSFLTSRELFAFCFAQRAFWRDVGMFVGWLAALQHGVDAFSITNIGSLILLDTVPTACFFDFSKPSFLQDCHVKLVTGSRLAYPIFVGSIPHVVTTAVNPPACGDAWTISVQLQRGRYRIKVSGWRNPFHGILDLWLDDVLVSGSAGLDCYSPETAELHIFPLIEVEITWTGMHVWRFETSRCRTQSNQYWICLQEFSAERIANDRPPAVPGVQSDLQGLPHACVSEAEDNLDGAATVVGE
jgi:hypothetical protein